MRHSLFESLEDGGAAAVEKLFDFDLGGSRKIVKFLTFPTLSCVHECELLLISTCYPPAKLMRHSLFESLEDGGAAAVEKRLDFDLGGVAKNYQIPNISHMKFSTVV